MSFFANNGVAPMDVDANKELCDRIEKLEQQVRELQRMYVATCTLCGRELKTPYLRCSKCPDHWICMICERTVYIPKDHMMYYIRE